MADAKVKFTKTFKKYKDEHRPEVVEAARAWASERADRLAVYEDDSIIKITGGRDDVDEMVQSLRSRFGEPLPGEDAPKKK